MSAAKTALVSLARGVAAERLYGDLDYYISQTSRRSKIIDQLCNFIDSVDIEWQKKILEKDKEIAELKAQQGKFVERVLSIPVASPIAETNKPTAGLT